MPWTALIGMNLLNLNYWGANQVILQRALAAKSLRHAQVGLLVGGVLKYVTLLIIVIPGIALAGILADAPLDDPDTAYMTLVTRFLPAGLRGLISLRALRLSDEHGRLHLPLRVHAVVDRHLQAIPAAGRIPRGRRSHGGNRPSWAPL